MKIEELVEGIEKIDGEAVLKGTLRINEVLFHAYFIEVNENEEGEQMPVDDPHRRLDDLYAMDPDEAFTTVKVPGFKGDYVLVIYPGKN